MTARYIFWDQPGRVEGSRAAHEAASRLQAALASASRFGIGARLAGSIDGDKVRVWRKAPFSSAGDVVEFSGVLRPEDRGSVIEGRFAYSFGTKVQFIGILAISVGVLAVGLLRVLDGASATDTLAPFGAVITAASLIWIYSAGRMKSEQIHFIEAQLRDVVDARAAG